MKSMTIKSDKWIRRMAAKGMIEPFDFRIPRSVLTICLGKSTYAAAHLIPNS